MKIWIWLILLSICTVNPSFALNLSATPTSGGNSLRFGRLDPTVSINKEVRLRITSADGQQYQVFQRLIEPLVNEQGQTLDRGALSTYSLVGSNSSGTLYLQSPERLGSADQLVYTSGPNGESDSLTIVYAVDFNQLTTPGNFLGRVQYVVRSLGSGQQDSVVLTVTLENEGEFEVDIHGIRQRNTIRINSDEKELEDSVEISFEGSSRSPVRVYQEAEKLPQNEVFEELRTGALAFAVEEIQGGGDTTFQSYAPLDRKRNLIYSTNDKTGKLIVHLRLNKDEPIKAGVYRGQTRYSVEGGEVRSAALNLEINIKPIFELDVQLPPEGMKFTKLLPDQPPEYHEVTVKIRSNLGRPYMVTQKLVAPLSNEKGESILTDAFSMKEELVANSAGKPVHSDFKAVPQEEAPIFFSESQGQSAQFKVIYRLRADKEGPTGDFRTDIIYSLGEM